MEKFGNVLKYYTDGACSGNPGPGGYAVVRVSRCYSQTMTEYIERLSLEEAYAEYCTETTNNREEMKAVIYVLKDAIDYPEYEYEIYSDSAYIVNMCNDWIWKWAKNNWTRGKNKPIENLDLVKEIYRLLNREFVNVKVIKCNGHAGVIENELADSLASGRTERFYKLLENNKILYDPFDITVVVNKT